MAKLDVLVCGKIDRVEVRVKAMVVLGLAVVGALGSGAAARAHDHRVPSAKLHVNSQVKRLGWWTSSWTNRYDPNYCSHLIADGVPVFRPRVEVDHLHPEPRIVFRKHQRPRVSAFADDRLRNGYLADGKALDLTLRARRPGDRRVWVARLEPTVRDKLFVDLNVSWRDREGCGGPQDASWAFGLKRAR